MAFLSAPQEGKLAEAKRLLQSLQALDDTGRITDHGNKVARLPLHPRLGHMLLLAALGEK